MNKAIGAVLGLTLIIGFASPAFARTVNYQGGSLDCVSGLFTDSIGNQSTIQTNVSQCAENGNPTLVTQAWGLTGAESQYLLIPPGSSVTDSAGFTIEQACPWYYNVMGCYNLTSLEYYKSDMRVIAHQLGSSWKYTQYWTTH